MKLKNFIMVLRPINLLMVGLTQLFIFQLLLYPLFDRYGILHTLSDRNAYLLVLVSVIMTGAGNLINDICDLRADIVNKPEKVFIGDMAINIQVARVYYAILVFTGGIIAAKIAWEINKPMLWLIYPVMTILLFSYSVTLKRLPIVGNFVIGIFAMFVPGIVLFSELQSIWTLHYASVVAYEFILFISIAYLTFSLFSTWYRELIKDLEDIEGDMMQSYLTYPVMSGSRESQYFSISLGYTLGVSMTFWLFILYNFGYGPIYYLLFMLIMAIPLMFIIRRTYFAQEKRDYTRISLYLKILMVNSLVFFILLISGF